MSHWGCGDPSNRAALKQTYLTHYSRIRSIVPAHKLLEFESKDGWKPLCKFLVKEVPEKEYPRSNDAAWTVQIHGFLYWVRLVKVSVVPVIVLMGIMVGGWKGWGMIRT